MFLGFLLKNTRENLLLTFFSNSTDKKRTNSSETSHDRTNSLYDGNSTVQHVQYGERSAVLTVASQRGRQLGTRCSSNSDHGPADSTHYTRHDMMNALH